MQGASNSRETMKRAAGGKVKLHGDIGYVRSLRCGKCGRMLPPVHHGMSNDDSIKKWGTSGRRHYCDDCWPKKMLEFWQVAGAMLRAAGRL